MDFVTWGFLWWNFVLGFFYFSCILCIFSSVTAEMRIISRDPKYRNGNKLYLNYCVVLQLRFHGRQGSHWWLSKWRLLHHRPWKWGSRSNTLPFVILISISGKLKLVKFSSNLLSVVFFANLIYDESCPRNWIQDYCFLIIAYCHITPFYLPFILSVTTRFITKDLRK